MTEIGDRSRLNGLYEKYTGKDLSKYTWDVRMELRLEGLEERIEYLEGRIGRPEV